MTTAAARTRNMRPLAFLLSGILLSGLYAQQVPTARAKDLPRAKNVIAALEGSDYRDTRAKRFGALQWLKMEVMDLQTRRLIHGDADAVLRDYHTHFDRITEEMRRSPVGPLGTGDKVVEAEWWKLVGHYQTDSAIQATAINAGGPSFAACQAARRRDRTVRAQQQAVEQQKRTEVRQAKDAETRSSLKTTGIVVLLIGYSASLALYRWLRRKDREAPMNAGPSATDPLTYMEGRSAYPFTVTVGKVIEGTSKPRGKGPMELFLKVEEHGTVQEYAVPSDLPVGAGDTVGRARLSKEGGGTTVYCYQADRGWELFTHPGRPWPRSIPIRRSLGYILLPVLSYFACTAWTMITMVTTNKLAALAILGQMCFTVVIARTAVIRFRGFIKAPPDSEGIYRDRFLPLLQATVKEQADRALRDRV